MKILEFQIQLLNKIFSDIFICFSLLTRIPVRKTEFKKSNIGKSCWAFPICGLVVGSISLIVFHVSIEVGFNKYIAAIFFVLINLFLTGALHEDGLADLADGMFVGKDVQSKLSIMSDSRIGVFGVLALMISVNLKIFLISELSHELNTYLHLIFIFMLSRYFMLFFLRFLRPLKKNGLGKGFDISENRTLLIGMLPIIPLIFFLGYTVIIIFFSMFIICLILLLIIRYKFSGQTGDICGASQQINEISGLLFLSVVL